MQLQRFDAAGDNLRTLLARDPDTPGVAISAAELARWRGDVDRADRILEEAHARMPDDPSIIHAIVEHSTYTDGVVLAMAESLLDRVRVPQARRVPAVSLARYFDRAGEPAKAWQLVTEANSLYEDRLRFDVSLAARRSEAAMRLHERTRLADTESGPALIYLTERRVAAGPCYRP